MSRTLISWIYIFLNLALWGSITYAGELEGSPRPEAQPIAIQSLSALIRAYLDSGNGRENQDVLARILAHPEADLETVSGVIGAGRSYGKEPVGLYPNVPVQVRGKTQGYGLYVPSSYGPDTSYPLVICLHGAGFTGASYLERWQPRLGDSYILACPTYYQGAWWTRFGENLVLATIRAVRARYHIDPDRIFLTGMSNGGIGAWIIGMHHAPLFAGVAPMASGLDDVLFPFLKNLTQTPVYIIHGARDRIMPVDLSRQIVKELDTLQVDYIYREHDHTHPHAGGHFFPRPELPALVSWFGKQQRNPFPCKVTLVRDASHLSEFGWVRIDATDRIAMFSEALTDNRDEFVKNRIYAELDVAIVGPNQVEVRTTRVRRYTIFLNNDLVDLSQPVTVVTNGVTSFQGIVNPDLETLLREARRRQDPRMLFPVQLTLAVEK
ncbi:MAG: hypothetical protein IH977_14945 [Nitrospinae bacterium]|nr:hypothetical protein [Nitrospinota bacterium]